MMLCALAFIPTAAAAHGEEILIFPISFAVLLLPALAVLAVRWHPVWWVRLVTVVVFLGTNVALWFSPVFPRTIGELAGYDLNKAMAILLMVPFGVAFATGLVLRRVVAGRHTTTQADG